MFLPVVGIFTLSCLLPSVFGTSNNSLFRVDVTMPFNQGNGRNELDDIKFMNSTLSGLTGINVHVARKALDNQHMILVLEVEKSCQWRSLRSALTRKGYNLAVKALEYCSDFAKLMGVNVTYHSASEIQDLSQLEAFEVTYSNEGDNGTEYLNYMKKHFELDEQLLAIPGYAILCYKVALDLPVRLMYFGLLNIDVAEGMNKEYVKLGKGFARFDYLESISTYDNTC